MRQPPRHQIFRRSSWSPVAAAVTLSLGSVSACGATAPINDACSASGFPGCSTDAAPPLPVCGDGVCAGDETVGFCPADCAEHPLCGDGVCSGHETGPNCPQDCLPVCGDAFCQLGESAATCALDCAPTCGDGMCEASELCEADCATCEPPECPAFDCREYCGLQAGCGYVGVDLVWRTAEDCVVDCQARNGPLCMQCIAAYVGAVSWCDADCDPGGCLAVCGTSVYCGG